MGLYNIFDGKYKNNNWVSLARSSFLEGTSGYGARYVSYNYINPIYIKEHAWILENPFIAVRGCAIAQRIADIFVASSTFPSLEKGHRLHLGPFGGTSLIVSSSGLYTKAERAYLLI